MLKECVGNASRTTAALCKTQTIKFDGRKYAQIEMILTVSK